MSTDNTSNNKRIAKNTLMLYLRMLFILLVALYTSRVVLNTLGVVDYGLYNVVGGIISMFGFLSGAMITSTQRYLTYELGKGDTEKLKVVFATSIQIHAILSAIILILGETIGLWFLYEKMVIPDERFNAAFWVYQISILTAIISIMSAPYNSAIVAHEKMGAFAAISIVEVILKLLIVYLLAISSFDKLILYAILVAIVQLLIRLIYTRYCNKHFEETKLIRVFDRSLITEMGKFAGWNMWGGLAATLYGTGLNLLLNVFFGPVVNAARGIATQVESAVTQFSTNFLMAVNPQITKMYAQGDLGNMRMLIFRSSKFTCFLLLALSLPLFMETEFILATWLKIIPDHTIIFVRLLLLIVIIDAISKPLMTAAAATGDVKKYQSIIGGILLSIVPISYIVLKAGGNPASVYVVYLVVEAIAFLVRLLIVRPMIELSLREYFIKVILPGLYVSVVSLLFAVAIGYSFSDGFVGKLLTCGIAAFIVVIISYAIGLSVEERKFVNTKIVSLLRLKHDKNSR